MSEALLKAQQRMRELREAGMVERLTPIERAARKPTSMRLAITAKCYECLGGADAKNIRREIRECTSPRCPLYPLRPYQQREVVL